jgi:plasmid stabilization system protein ParE
MIVRLLSPALRELEEATLYYESRREGLGAEFADEFDRSIAAILDAPTRWPASDKQTRRYRMDRFQYSIFCGLHGDEIVIVAVSHPSRQTNYWVDRI